ncbi:MAG: NAD(P)H-dependent glycerol-3-phosphate dehydrogenase [Succinivibrio sp.]|nr:NAD(P)H-dependent glycerol-3-phosphate dehydrogenase [Succinivibrio sp.]
MSQRSCELCILGAGSYGTALAVAVASKGTAVMLWDHNPQKVAAMQHERVNARYLPQIPFPSTLQLCSDLGEALSSARDLLVVVPSHTFKELLTAIVPLLSKEHRLAWATKGLDPHSGAVLSELTRELVGPEIPLAAISGPTFALELARGMPTAISVAGTDPLFSSALCNLMHTPTFRIYESSDLLGLQLGGALKNVIAIAAGLSDGMGFGANARTALITRGLAEMVRYGQALGATERSFQGLSGLGDLILTCTDDQSRNRRFGYLLGRGAAVQEALSRIGQVVEGYTMTYVMHEHGIRRGVNMPICQEVYEILYEGKDGRAAAASLLGRSQKSE